MPKKSGNNARGQILAMVSHNRETHRPKKCSLKLRINLGNNRRAQSITQSVPTGVSSALHKIERGFYVQEERR